MTKRPPLPFEVLRKEFLKNGIQSISYEELLWTVEWLDFRNSIKDRDKLTCTKCQTTQLVFLTDSEYDQSLIESGYGKFFDLIEGKFVDTPTEFTMKKNTVLPSRQKIDKNIKLEVHHKYYIWKRLPWEYDQSALTTLCETCHENEHNKARDVFVDQTLTSKKELDLCNKCVGKGYLPEFKHVQNGVCFDCWGIGGIEKGTLSNNYDLTKRNLI